MDLHSYDRLHASLRIVSPKHKTLKIGLNDDTLKAFLTKIVWFAKCYSVVYITMIVFDQLIRKKKKFLFHSIYWNDNKSSILLCLRVHMLYHLIFVSLLYAYIFTRDSQKVRGQFL